MPHYRAINTGLGFITNEDQTNDGLSFAGVTPDVWLVTGPDAAVAAWAARVSGTILSADEVNQIEVARQREVAKVARAKAVAAITVTVGDKVFDGDEISQGRMARAIIGMQAVGAPTTQWTLANNAEVEATLEELTAAMVMAGKAQSALWALP